MHREQCSNASKSGRVLRPAINAYMLFIAYIGEG